MSRDTVTDLLEAIQAGKVDSLSPFEYLLLKDYMKSFQPLLNEYEAGRDKLRANTPIGGYFNYRGQQYVVRKMRTQTDWGKAYRLALAQIANDHERNAIEDTVAEEYTKEVSTAEPVY